MVHSDEPTLCTDKVKTYLLSDIDTTTILIITLLIITLLIITLLIITLLIIALLIITLLIITLLIITLLIITLLLEQYFKRHPTTKFNKTPSAKYILL